MMSMLQRATLLLVLSGSLLPLAPPLMADETVLPPDHGFMLIRFKLNPTEKIATFAISNVDTDEEVKIGTRSFLTAGANAWMAIVPAPPGRYFWSEFESIYGTGVEASRNLNQGVRRTAPGSASDSFEIVSGVVNYVGDWQMRRLQSQKARLDAVIEFDKSTLERYVADYAELANKYEIYLSMMGKEAISLDELAKLTAK